MTWHKGRRLLSTAAVLGAVVFLHAEAASEEQSPGGLSTVDGFVVVDGGRIYYESTGVGTPLIFIHDGILHRETWDDQFADLGRSFRAVRWDRRGYGRSPAPTAPFSHIDDLLALMKSLSIERAVLIACSAGGMLALHFALDHPTMVSALVLVGPIVSGLSFSDHFTSRGGRAVPPPVAPIDQRIEYWTKTDPWITAPTSTAAKARMRALMAANPTNGAGGQFARWSEPALGRIAQIKVPTLLITGESDIPDVHSHMGAIQAGIAGSRRVVLPNAGHLPHLEVPRAFNAEVRKFLP
jgi:pimeloyl-ACP methyl ester carboxylesterase